MRRVVSASVRALSDSPLSSTMSAISSGKVAPATPTKLKQQHSGEFHPSNTLDSAQPFQSPSKLRKQYLAKHSHAAAVELAEAVSSTFGVTASPISSASTISPSPFRDRRMMLSGNTHSPSKLRMASPAGKSVSVNLLDRMTKLHAPDMLSPQRSKSSSSSSAASPAAAAPWSGTNSTFSPASVAHPHGNIRDASPLRMKSDASVTSHAPGSGSSNRTVLQPIHQAKLSFQPSPLRSPAVVATNIGTLSGINQRSNPNVTRRLFDLPTRRVITGPDIAPPQSAAAATATTPPAATVIEITPSNFLARLQVSASASPSSVTPSARKRKQPAESPAETAPAVTLDTFFSSSQSSLDETAASLRMEQCDFIQGPIVKQEFPVVKHEPISQPSSPAIKRTKL